MAEETARRTVIDDFDNIVWGEIGDSREIVKTGGIQIEGVVPEFLEAVEENLEIAGIFSLEDAAADQVEDGDRNHGAAN
jgi:hypothetical protein